MPTGKETKQIGSHLMITDKAAADKRGGRWWLVVAGEGEGNWLPLSTTFWEL